jgi:rod shape determining protein RodA
MYRHIDSSEPTFSLGLKLRLLNWGLVFLVTLISGIGAALLYSAAGGNLEPWAIRQMTRFGIGFVLMLMLAMVDIRVFLRYAYILHAIAIVLLLVVEVKGKIGMGAQRWIDLGFFQLQPSELAKITLVLALARYFHGLTYEQVGRPLVLLPPLAMIFIPVGLVLLQPNLGTATILTLVGGSLMMMAGVRLWKFLIIIVGGVSALPVLWEFMHDYQKQRVYTFLDPERDPLGAGYNIMQSKIAFGSGGLIGQGFMNGSQSQLRFLPEKETDFIFTLLGEEFGLIGTLFVLGLFLLVLIYGFAIALSARMQFARLVAGGITINIFFYIFINVAMVTGIIPVVGIPMPLVSYGGTAMLTTMIATGILLSVSIHREVKVPRVFSSDSL